MKRKIVFSNLRIVIKYLKEYKRELGILTFLGLLSALTHAFLPYLIGRLFDSILEPTKISLIFWGEIPLFLFFLFLWLAVQFLANLVDWQSNLKSDRLGENVFCDFTIKGFGKLLELPLSFHKEKKMGEIAERINRAAHSLEVITSRVIIDLTPQFLSILVALLITFLIKPSLALILVGGVIFYLITLLKIVSPAAEIQRKMFRAYGKAFGHAYEAIFNIQEVKQATTESYEKRNFYQNFKLKASKLWGELVKIWQSLNFSQRMIIMFTQLTIFLLSIFFIKKGEMTLGQLVMFNGYALMFFQPFVVIGRNWQTIQNGLIALERAEKILSFPSEIYFPKNLIILSDIKGRVSFQNISFTYKKSQSKVLDNVSFEVEPGEVIALVGESGVGKSTLVDLISGYYFPQKGKVLIDGHNIKNLDLKFLRSKIALVPQEIVLFNESIKNNIKYGNFSASEESLKIAAEKAHCLEFIERLPQKWNQLVGERGIKLSVGQKQRVAIARAILRDPRILILDEPTSALDPQSEKIIQKSLEDLMSGRTTFIIAHRLSTVKKADRIFVLDKGKIVEQGSHQELIKIPQGIYRKFYQLQMGLV